MKTLLPLVALVSLAAGCAAQSDDAEALTSNLDDNSGFVLGNYEGPGAVLRITDRSVVKGSRAPAAGHLIVELTPMTEGEIVFGTKFVGKPEGGVLHFGDPSACELTLRPVKDGISVVEGGGCSHQGEPLSGTYKLQAPDAWAGTFFLGEASIEVHESDHSAVSVSLPGVGKIKGVFDTSAFFVNAWRIPGSNPGGGEPCSLGLRRLDADHLLVDWLGSCKSLEPTSPEGKYARRR